MGNLQMNHPAPATTATTFFKKSFLLALHLMDVKTIPKDSLFMSRLYLCCCSIIAGPQNEQRRSSKSTSTCLIGCLGFLEFLGGDLTLHLQLVCDPRVYAGCKEKRKRNNNPDVCVSPPGEGGVEGGRMAISRSQTKGLCRSRAEPSAKPV